MFKIIARLMKTKLGMSITLSIWILTTIALTFLAPGARSEVSGKEGSGLPADSYFELANTELEKYFKNDEGLQAILVFTSDQKDLTSITNSSKNIADANIEQVKEVLPLHMLPPQVLQTLSSEDRSSISLPITLLPNLETEEITEALTTIKETVSDTVSNTITYKMTGPEKKLLLVNQSTFLLPWFYCVS